MPPAGGVKGGPGKLPKPRYLRVPRDVQAAHAKHHHPRPQRVAACGLDLPTASSLIPGQAADLGVEADLLVETVPIGDPLEVGQDLGLRGVVPSPAGVLLERQGVEV